MKLKHLRTYENFSSDEILYHGTSMKQWNTEHGEESSLYLTNDEHDAENYSYETCASEDEIDEETGEVVVHSEPILCTIPMDNLKKLDIEFEPDWGAFGVTDETTWEDTYKSCGCFSILGDIDSIKKHFQIKKIQ